MKKFILCTIGILLAAAAVTAIYRFNFRKQIPADAPLTEQVAAILEQNDCLVCHTPQGDAPFYATLPVIGPRIQGHMHRGTRFVDLKSAVADLDAINEADLAKLEQALTTGSMPVLEYRLVHWGTGFNREEKSVLARWIAQTRAELFATGLAAEEFAGEPVCPIAGGIPVDSAKVVLGYRLYHDGRISADGTVSCATCHPLDKGGMDNTRTSEGIFGQFGGVNAPTVYNAVYNHKQFWNGRAADLAEQAAGPPVNPVEMGTQSWDDIVARLRTDKELVRAFENTYPEGLTAQTVTDAIGEFEKTLTTPDSPFDRYLKGDKNALTAAEIAGYEAFKEHKCATCHTGQLMGGQSFEYFGITDDYFAHRPAEIPTVEDDKGLFGFTGDSLDIGRFKVPTLRNIALTAPYLHDGSAATLEEAVGKMMRYQIGEPEDDPHIPEIVAFLRTLTGKNPHLTAAE